MRLQVTAPLAVAQLTNGTNVHVYTGAVIPVEVTPTSAAHLLAEGLVVDLDDLPTIEDDVRAQLATTKGTSR